MRRLWVSKFADAVVQTLQEAVRVNEWNHSENTPQNVRLVLDQELEARLPERWIGCWSDRWSDQLLLKSAHLLGVADFCLPFAARSGLPGLWGIVKRKPDWEALRSEIRTKALWCLRLLRDAEQTADVPEYYCSQCDVFAFGNRKCSCASTMDEDTNAKWCGYHWRQTYPNLNVLVRQSGRPSEAKTISWPDARQFLSFFVEWFNESHLKNWLQFASVDADGLMFKLCTRDHAELLLGNGKHTLYLLAIGRLIRTNVDAGGKLLTGTPHRDRFQSQLNLLLLPSSE